MRPEQRTMNIATYRHCFVICQEVKERRKGLDLRKRDYPAAIVSCALRWEDFKLSKVEESGKVCWNSYHRTPDLENALAELGPIGRRREECKNAIGACAEPHAARAVMEEHHNVAVKSLVFSYAYRPRTKCMIRYCRNCVDVFNVQNP